MSPLQFSFLWRLSTAHRARVEGTSHSHSSSIHEHVMHSRLFLQVIHLSGTFIGMFQFFIPVFFRENNNKNSTVSSTLSWKGKHVRKVMINAGSYFVLPPTRSQCNWHCTPHLYYLGAHPLSGKSLCCEMRLLTYTIQIAFPLPVWETVCVWLYVCVRVFIMSTGARQANVNHEEATRTTLGHLLNG